MTAILTGMTDVVTAVLGVVTSVVGTIVAQPLLLIPILIGFISIGVGLFRKLRQG